MHILQEVFVVLVFFISGLTLKTDEIAKALRFKFELAYGMVTILFLTGFLGFAMKAIPLMPPEFSIGEHNFSNPGAAGIGRVHGLERCQIATTKLLRTRARW